MLSFARFILIRLARTIYRYPRFIVFLALALTGISLWLTLTKLTTINDTNALIRSSSPTQRNYLNYKAEFGVEDDFVIIVQSPDPEKNKAVVNEIGADLRALQPEVRNILDRLDFSRMKSRFLLFESKEDLLKIESELREKADVLRKQNVHFDLNSMLSQATSKFDDKYLRKADNWKEFKPFIDQFISLLNTLADELEGAKSANASKKTGGVQSNIKAGDEAHGQVEDLNRKLSEHEYPQSFDDGQLILVSAQPGHPPEGSAPYSATIKKLRDIITDLRIKYPGVSINLTGQPILDDDELQTSSDDAVKGGVLAFVLVALLFLLSYRRSPRPVLALLVLAMGLSLSLGFTVLTVGHLNLISEAFVAMIIGLGIDFGIQIMGRYEEEMANGRSVLDAIEQTLQHTGLAIITGGSTTAAAFFTMCFNDFIGLSEFGVIAGGGILICLALSLTVLPALFILRDRSRPIEKLRERAQASSWKSWSGLNSALTSRPFSVLAVAGVVTGLSLIALPRVFFNYNLLDLQNPKLESVQQIKALLHSSAGSQMSAVSIADNIDQAKERIARFQALPSVKAEGVRSLVDLFPTDVEEKLVIIRRIVDSLHGLNLKTDVSSQIDVVKCRLEMADLLAMSQEGKKEAEKYLKISTIIHDPRAQDAIDVFGKLIPPP